MNSAISESIEVILAGGPLMAVLFMLALGIYWLAIDTIRTLYLKKYSTYALSTEFLSASEARIFELEHLRFIKHRKSHLQILVTAAPLLGLLGTVMGMLATFQGLNASNGNTVDLIAAGISEAMITTETGLVIAIPATFMVMVINTKIQRIENTLRKNEGKQLLAQT